MERDFHGTKLDIISLQNPRVKHLVKLRDDKRTRTQDGLMLVEGYDEIQLALSAGHKPTTILSSPEFVTQASVFTAPENLTVSHAVFEKISYRDNPDGWLAVFPIPQTKIENIKFGASPLIIIAESIEKPGNLGAILRTADASGVDAVLVCDARVDVWNPNVVRASRGAVFSVPVVECDNARALEWLKTGMMRIIAATPSADEIYSNADMS